MSRRHESVFDDPDVSAELAELHHKFVAIPADKVSNNIVFVCKKHIILSAQWRSLVCVQQQETKHSNTPRCLGKILQNHNLVMVSFGVSLSDEDLDLPK